MDALEFLGAHGQTVAAFIGVYFSLLSLFVAGTAARFLKRQTEIAEEQAQAARKHNQLSVRPIVHTWIRSKGSEVCIEAENSGIGPAMLTNMQVLGPEKFCMAAGYEAYELVLEMVGFRRSENGKILEQSEPGVPFALKPGASLTLLRIEGIAWDADQASSFAENLRRHFGLIVEYESMYGERFRAGESAGTRPC